MATTASYNAYNAGGGGELPIPDENSAFPGTSGVATTGEPVTVTVNSHK